MAARPSLPRPNYLVIGEILRPHGVGGELKMRVLTGYPERLKQLQTIYLATHAEAANPIPHELVSVRMNQAYALLTVRGIHDREAADRLRQLVVLVAIEDAAPLEEGEHYLFELIGLDVETVEGEQLGTLIDVLETGANDVYIVRGERYGEVLIPATSETIVETNTETGIMRVRLPDGLLPEPKNLA